MKSQFIKFDLPENNINEINNIILQINYIYDFDFAPMEKNDIHMTLCFMGCIFGNYFENKKEVINKIQNYIDNFNLNDEILEFDSYQLFPKNKQNLIVATFKLSPKLLKKIMEFKKLFVQFGIKKELTFIPHITLGKIQNKNDKIKVDLSKIPKPKLNIILSTCSLHKS
jgi:2'-5' RNA ligase